MAGQCFFVTGLCMQGNKGGPAIALALTRAIRQHIPDADFIFAVPGGPGFVQEQRWAERYGFQVIEHIYDLRHLLPPFAFSPVRMKRLWRWVSALRDCRAMIQMSAISYVGPPSANPRLRSLLSGRFMDFYMARLCRRPMLAWTQSYGPLSTRWIRLLAKIDLKRQPAVFCRGDDCLVEVRALVPDKAVYSYPDIAVALPYDTTWALEYLRGHSLPVSDFVTISPSAVIFAKSERKNGSNGHIEYLEGICRELHSRGLPVLIVPHTYRPGRHHPAVCDYGTSLELMRHLQGLDQVHLLNDDLSPIELKSIIARASIHIGGRYHSVVAALSSGVPAISLSWHPKYKDLMRIYDMEEFVLTEEDSTPMAMIDGLLDRLEPARAKIATAHRVVAQQSAENVAMFIELLGGGA